MANEGETDAPVTAKGKRGRAGTRQVQAVPDAADGAADAGGDASSGTALKKKDLLERVMALSKAKKKDVKDVVETTLKVLGEALAKGEDLNLPPLGRAKVNRQKGVAGGDMYIIRLRRSNGKRSDAADTTEALAEAQD